MFFSFHHPQKDKQRKQRHSLKLGKKRRESSKRNYYIISPRVIIKAIIITLLNFETILGFCHTVRILFSFFSKTFRFRKCDIKRRKVTNVTNPKLLQGSFQAFRKCLGFEATFCSDKPLITQECWFWPRLRPRFWISLGTTQIWVFLD